VHPQTDHQEFDAIIVGSGPGGATVARELSKRNKRVLILERGGAAPGKEGFLATASVLSNVSVGDRLATTRALTTGGTTAVYFAVAQFHPLEAFRALGIDLSDAVEEAKAELPLAVLPDELVGAQTLKVRESAMALGYPWVKRTMLVDQSKCPSGYAYDAKWTAGRYVRAALAHGATLIHRARVLKVLVDGNRAIGVEYTVGNGKKESETRRVFGGKVILAAGAAASPVILRNSGIRNVVDRGFCCHPSVAVFGLVPGLKAGETFAGCEGADLPEDISVGDANLGSVIYRMYMLGDRRFVRAWQHSRSIALGVMVNDSQDGVLREDGRYHKQLTAEDLAKVEKGVQMARRIIGNAGGTHIIQSRVGAGHLSGTVRLREHVDENLQTEFDDLHVCDGSLIPAGMKVSPTLPLICLGKYLAARLSPAA
jgi:choline dehydrogenase-like flavoprotein